MAQEEKKKTNKLAYMILSVIIAIVAWSVVTYTTDPDITKTLTGVRVEITGENVLAQKGLTVINYDDIPRVSVKMRGKRSDLINAIDKTKIIVDVSEISAAGEFEIDGTTKVPNSRITVEKVSLQAIPITVDEYETREIPVRIIQTGELSGRVVKSSPEMETVPIKGAKSELDLIEAAEVIVDISNMAETNSTEFEYSLVLTNGMDYHALYTLDIENDKIVVNNTLYDAREVPIKVIVRNGATYMLDEDATRVDPGSVTVGVGEGVDVSYVTVTIDEDSEEGEYKIDKADGVYIPDNARTVTIKPVWEDTN